MSQSSTPVRSAFARIHDAANDLTEQFGSKNVNFDDEKYRVTVEIEDMDDRPIIETVALENDLNMYKSGEKFQLTL